MGLLTSEIRDTVLGMCGRYASTRSATDLAFLFGAEDETGDGLAADYNIAPTDPVAMIRIASSGARVVSPARWGLVPPWAKDTGGAARMINARVETAATSPAFRRSFERRRCLVPADGWYEWVRADVHGMAQADEPPALLPLIRITAPRRPIDAETRAPDPVGAPAC